MTIDFPPFIMLFLAEGVQNSNVLEAKTLWHLQAFATLAWHRTRTTAA